MKSQEKWTHFADRPNILYREWYQLVGDEIGDSGKVLSDRYLNDIEGCPTRAIIAAKSGDGNGWMKKAPCITAMAVGNQTATAIGNQTFRYSQEYVWGEWDRTLYDIC